MTAGATLDRAPRALPTAVAATLALALVGAGCGAAHAPRPLSTAPATPRIAPMAASTHPVLPVARRHAAGVAAARAPFAVGLRIETFVDEHRHLRLPGGRLLGRRLVTLIRYPARGRPGSVDLAGAAPVPGRFPLVVFGHGFAVTPAIYARLLQAWAGAGYVVVAPVFPLENANAPGGPNESDLINQPGDMSLVISRMLAASANRNSALAGTIDRRAIAVTGQSDGGETALATAYYAQFRDRRVRAAVILSGANIPGVGAIGFPSASPPLLATQGTADSINPPSFTRAFFDIAPRPKFLLTLLEASHLGPYTDAQPQLGIVERVTTAFLDRYLKHAAGSAAQLTAAGHVPRVATLRADP
ncbi:MAG: hypothetical protein QOF77_1623 [Solirubrobacteraceae bacterium]|jgi:dienelactone hydrolase|nr:hypothetical protein [Solirubrobacteraceae bacterium]